MWESQSFQSTTCRLARAELLLIITNSRHSWNPGRISVHKHICAHLTCQLSFSFKDSWVTRSTLSGNSNLQHFPFNFARCFSQIIDDMKIGLYLFLPCWIVKSFNVEKNSSVSTRDFLCFVCGARAKWEWVKEKLAEINVRNYVAADPWRPRENIWKIISRIFILTIARKEIFPEIFFTLISIHCEHPRQLFSNV